MQPSASACWYTALNAPQLHQRAIAARCMADLGSVHRREHMCQQRLSRASTRKPIHER